MKLDKTRPQKNEKASIAGTRIGDQLICTLWISMKVFIGKLSYIFRGYGAGQYRPVIAAYVSMSSYELCSLELAGLVLLMFSIPSVFLSPAPSSLCSMSTEGGEYLMGLSPLELCSQGFSQCMISSCCLCICPHLLQEEASLIMAD